MNSKKNIIRYIIYGILIVLILCVPSVSAHSGRTDSQGGHNSPSGYHYHHGYPAHQHINGTCPYNFDDKTNHKSSQSSEKDKLSTQYEDSVGSKSDNKPANTNWWIIVLLLIIVAVPNVIGLIMHLTFKFQNIKSQKTSKARNQNNSGGSD